MQRHYRVYIAFLRDLRYNIVAAWNYTLTQYDYRERPFESYMEYRIRLERNNKNLVEIGDTINYCGEFYRRIK